MKRTLAMLLAVAMVLSCMTTITFTTVSAADKGQFGSVIEYTDKQPTMTGFVPEEWPTTKRVGSNIPEAITMMYDEDYLYIAITSEDETFKASSNATGDYIQIFLNALTSAKADKTNVDANPNGIRFMFDRRAFAAPGIRPASSYRGGGAYVAGTTTITQATSFSAGDVTCWATDGANGVKFQAIIGIKWSALGITADKLKEGTPMNLDVQYKDSALSGSNVVPIAYTLGKNAEELAAAEGEAALKEKYEADSLAAYEALPAGTKGIIQYTDKAPTTTSLIPEEWVGGFLKQADYTHPTSGNVYPGYAYSYMWDEDNIYVALKIRDNVLDNKTDWNSGGDTFGIFVNTTKASGLATGGADANNPNGTAIFFRADKATNSFVAYRQGKGANVYAYDSENLVAYTNFDKAGYFDIIVKMSIDDLLGDSYANLGNGSKIYLDVFYSIVNNSTNGLGSQYRAYTEQTLYRSYEKESLEAYEALTAGTKGVLQYTEKAPTTTSLIPSEWVGGFLKVAASDYGPGYAYSYLWDEENLYVAYRTRDNALTKPSAFGTNDTLALYISDVKASNIRDNYTSANYANAAALFYAPTANGNAANFGPFREYKGANINSSNIILSKSFDIAGYVDVIITVPFDSLIVDGVENVFANPVNGDKIFANTMYGWRPNSCADYLLGYYGTYTEWTLTGAPVTEFTVSYDMNGFGDAIASETVQAGATATAPTAPTAAGYTFGGWYTDAECTVAYDFATAVNADITLYAKWTKDIVYYTVTFVDADIEDMTVVEGGKVAQPEAPDKVGHTFGGWYADAEYAEEFDFDAAINANTTIYAKWTINTYDVVFEGAGTQTVNYGEKVVKPADPSKEGHTFAGWFVDEACTALFNFDTAIAADMNIYAGWTINSYTVSFSDADDQTVDFGGKAVKPADPSKEGYTFGGWFVDEECTVAYDFDAAVTADVKLFAKWDIITFTVTFDGANVDAQTIIYGEKVANPGIPVVSGYVFGGWYADAGYAEEFDFDAEIFADTTIYAKWTKLHNVSFVMGVGPAVDAIEVLDGETFDLPVVPEVKDYIFSGWYTDADFEVAYVGGPVTADVVLYAKWIAKDYVAQVGDDKFETFAEAFAAVEDGDTLTLLEDMETSDIIKIEKDITIDLGGKTVTGTNKKVFEVYADVTFKNGTIIGANRCIDTRTAVELNVIDVTLIADNYTSFGNPQPLTIGGSDNGTVVVLDGVSISAAAGYGIITFVETDLTATDCTITGYNALYVKPGSENSEFKFNNCTLTGSTGLNDVEGNSTSVIAIQCDDIDVIVEGGTINAIGNYMVALGIGYVEVPENTGVNATINATINGNLIDVWFEGNTIKLPAVYADALDAYVLGDVVEDMVQVLGVKKFVSFNMNGMGDQIATQTILKGEKATEPAAPAFEGYTFGGWFVDEVLTEAYDFDAAVTEDVELFAKWTINTYTVTFDGANAQTVNYGDKVAKPADPTKDGYTFDGWFVGDVAYDFDAPVTADVELTSKWTFIYVAPTLSYVDNKLTLNAGTLETWTVGVAYIGKETFDVSTKWDGFVAACGGSYTTYKNVAPKAEYAAPGNYAAFIKYLGEDGKYVTEYITFSIASTFVAPEFKYENGIVFDAGSLTSWKIGVAYIGLNEFDASKDAWEQFVGYSNGNYALYTEAKTLKTNYGTVGNYLAFIKYVDDFGVTHVEYITFGVGEFDTDFVAPTFNFADNTLSLDKGTAESVKVGVAYIGNNEFVVGTDNWNEFVEYGSQYTKLNSSAGYVLYNNNYPGKTYGTAGNYVAFVKYTNAYGNVVSEYITFTVTK